MRTDLHIHSNLSCDGNLSIEEILCLCEKEKLTTISITDHNTALAHFVIKHINLKKYFSGNVISGIEIDVCDNGITFELLAYDFEVEPVLKWAYNKFGTVETRQKKIYDALMQKCEILGFKMNKTFPWNPKAEFAHINIYNNIMQNSNNIKLFNREILDGSSFYRYSTTDKEFILYLDMTFLWASIQDVVQLIKKSGGIVVFAHPYGYKTNLDVDKILSVCLENKVDGIEVYHTKHSKEQIKYLEKFCEKHNLHRTGGSDFHGSKDDKLASLENLSVPFIK